MLDKFKIGHYTDIENGTGATVIISESGAVGGCCIRGAAPATRETDLLDNGKTVQEINAVVLAGGSAFGLEASTGVVEYLYENNIGYNTGKYRVPIVVGACLYDLEYKNFAYPNKDNGFQATKDAVINNFIKGDIGAGTGATVSKIFGVDSAVKGGLGVQTVSLNGLEVAIVVAVNALGDIVKNGEIIAGCTRENGEFVDCRRVFSAGVSGTYRANTTIGCILTNAKLSKEQANMLCDIAHDGFATSISPAHTTYDGDAMFLMASGEKSVSFNILAGIIPKLTEEAIQSVVRDTKPIKKHVNAILMKVLTKALDN